MKRTWIIMAGLMISILAVVGLTVIPAMAQDAESETPEKNTRCEVYHGKLAQNLGVTVEDLEAAIIATKVEMVNEAVANGKLTQEKADIIIEKIEKNGTCGFVGLKKRVQRHLGHLDARIWSKAIEKGVITQEQADEVKEIRGQIATYIKENGWPEIGPRDGESLGRLVEEGIITQQQANTITSVMESIKEYAKENGLRAGMKGHGNRGGQDQTGMKGSDFSGKGQRSGGAGAMEMGFGA